MSAVAGAPDQIKEPRLSSVEGIAVSPTPTALGLGCYVVTVKTRVYANSPAEACTLIENTLLGKSTHP